uniref:Uncharacterized protein n=1 Tax=Amphimedon queenslandica TaxID=400682 RepID=A0A1X7TQH7_AMPQE
MMVMMMMKKRQGLESRYGDQWSPLVKKSLSIKSGKHRSSFSLYSNASKDMGAILVRGESYLAMLLHY